MTVAAGAVFEQYNTDERVALVRDLSDRKLSDKQVRMAIFLADKKYVPGELRDERDYAAVRVLDGLREFNRLEREAKETGEPVKKAPSVALARAVEELAELKHEHQFELDYIEGVDDSIKTLEELAA